MLDPVCVTLAHSVLFQIDPQKEYSPERILPRKNTPQKEYLEMVERGIL